MTTCEYFGQIWGWRNELLQTVEITQTLRTVRFALGAKH